MVDNDNFGQPDIDRFYGKYRGIVLDNTPDGLGRIKVLCTSVMRDIPLLAMPCVPYAGVDVGFRFLPENDDNVWVEFEAGDPCYPIWTGCFWKLDEFKRIQDASHIKLIKTEKVTIEIDDQAGSITIEHANGTVFKIEGTDISSEANGKITQTVKTMKTTLDVTKFDVHDGALSVA
jgi:hypothetical protein